MIARRFSYRRFFETVLVIGLVGYALTIVLMLAGCAVDVNGYHGRAAGPAVCEQASANVIQCREAKN